ncbi:hypothetical protein GH714_028256 [Hevea brasiliensis]|uniref:PPIase cyclophilin-type domain-containing protein n=1 Tax=Hevea brasiliensis TaxID=3981 RepID=A0A6A6LE23_HEVBR|nr:hypothetical protein GH714_028256 [Hevea brasiliensis]
MLRLQVEKEVTWQLKVSQMNGRDRMNVQGSRIQLLRDPSKPPPKLKFITRKGKLEIDEEVGTEPNGREFVIATRDSPELLASNLAVGRVIEGMEVVKRIGQVKMVQENTASPYSRVNEQ